MNKAIHNALFSIFNFINEKMKYFIKQIKVNCNMLSEILLNKYFLVPNALFFFFNISEFHATTKRKKNACSN